MSQRLFFIRQAGGKWGRTYCPACRAGMDYKFTQSAGGCNTCGCLCYYTGGLRLPFDQTDRPDVLIELEYETKEEVREVDYER